MSGERTRAGAQSGSAGVRARKPRLVAVDDEPQVLVALRDQFEDAYEVHTAANGADALARLAELRDVAVLLADQRLSGMAGDELLARAAESNDATPVLITGYADLEAVIRAVNCGRLYGYVTKPWEAHELRMMVDRAAEHHRLKRALQEERDELRRVNQGLERRVQERTAELEALIGELDAFSFSVSHDLRTPVRHIDAFARIVLEDHGEALGDDGRGGLKRVLEAAQEMNRLIDDLLGLARASRAEMARGNLDLAALARAAFDALKAVEPERAIALTTAAELPARADPGLVRVVLNNLIANAWKYTRKREGARIEVDSAAIDGGRAFFVRDNGAGFDMRYAEKLFRPFQRLHSASEFEGSGIGLATVQRIVRRHGGRIWAEGAVGSGATFYFTLEPASGGEVSESGSPAAAPD